MKTTKSTITKSIIAKSIKAAFTALCIVAGLVFALDACSSPNNDYEEQEPIIPPVVVQVLFDLNGGSGGNPPASILVKNGRVDLPELPSGVTKSSAEFSGWSRQQNGGTIYPVQSVFPPLGKESGISKTTTLYAVWSTGELKVTFEPNFAGENVPQKTTWLYSKGDEISLPPSLFNRGDDFVFIGWSTTEGAQDAEHGIGDKYKFEESVEDFSFYAVWRKMVKLELHHNDGSNRVYTSSVRSGASANLRILPEENFQFFKGWHTKEVAVSTSEGVFDIDYPVVQVQGEDSISIDVGEDDIVLYAIWYRPEYTVKYEPGAADVSGILESATKKRGEMITLPSEGFSKDFFVINGWRNKDDIDSKTHFPGDEYQVMDHITFVPTWRKDGAQPVTIIFNGNGGNGTGAAPITDKLQGDTAALPGKVFDDRGNPDFLVMTGWAKNSDGTGTLYGLGGQITLGDDEADTVTLYAVWKELPVTITYNLNGGDTQPPTGSSVDTFWGRKIKLHDGTGFRKNFHYLRGWHTNPGSASAEFGLGAENYSVPKTNTPLYAVWERPNFTIRFDTNGGTGQTASITALWGETRNLPTVGSGISWEFRELLGWSSAPLAVVEGNHNVSVPYALGAPFDIPEKDITLSAMWRHPEDKVKYEKNTGTGPDDFYSVGKLRGETITLSSGAGFTKENRELVGWHELPDGKENTSGFYKLGATYQLKKSLSLYAVWKQNFFAVTFDANYPTDVPDNYKQGRVPTLPPQGHGDLFDLPDPQATGLAVTSYQFNGWSANSPTGVSYPIPSKVSISANTVFYAKWQDMGRPSLDGNGSGRIRRGETGDFTAILGGSIQPDELAWTVKGNVSEDTTLTPNGVKAKLVVDIREKGVAPNNLLDTEGKLTVRVEYTKDPNIYWEGEITIYGRRELGDWKMVSIGQDHTMAIDNNGVLYAWGRNRYYQLAHDTNATDAAGKRENPTPTRVGGASDWILVNGAFHHTLGIRRVGQNERLEWGTLWAWGRQQYGKLGNNKTADANIKDLQQVGGAGGYNDWIYADAGIEASYGIRLDGTLYAWGHAANGRLGNPDNTTDQGTPIPVGSAAQRASPEWKFDSVTSAGHHAVAIRKDGTLWAWGQNDKGQIGNGKTDNITTPVEIKHPDGLKWKSASAGFDFTIALDVNGTAYSWGNNDDTRLGRTTSDTSDPSPGKVNGNHKWASVMTGQNHVLVIELGTEELYAWGQNSRWQVTGKSGDAQSEPYHFRTDASLQEEKWVSMNGGGWFSLAVREDGKLWAWGANDYGQLGVSQSLGTGNNVTTPPTNVKKP
ncbi:MAG: InlB B-repeat-containing protein [Treponema sp.]|nr:InlB B-repeat-containing protein [Treponema sp.]